VASFFKRQHYYGAQYITGPQYLVLLLDLQNERIDDPYVVALGEDGLYETFPEENVRSAVLEGTDAANRQCNTNIHPLEIRYFFSSYDKTCRLMRGAAKAIVEELARKGPENFGAE
jgi:hypothetical protein